MSCVQGMNTLQSQHEQLKKEMSEKQVRYALECWGF